MAITATVNGKLAEFAGESATPLLWALREELGLTGRSSDAALANLQLALQCRCKREIDTGIGRNGQRGF